MKNLEKKSWLFIKNIWLIRKLNITFTGTYLTGFTYWPDPKKHETFIKLFFSNNKSLCCYATKGNLETIKLEQNSIKSAIEAWKTSKINGFSFIDFCLRKKISLFDRKRGKRMLMITVIKQPEIN